jgi:hypothetical protein
MLPRATAALLVLAATAPGAPAGAIRLPGGAELPQVDFERHVVSLLAKAGCNTGACHGSFQGKGGFRLSLFGQDADKDFRALTRDGEGRRLNRYDPDQSVMLLKATGQVSHGGGRRIDPHSWQYQILRDWVAGGCRRAPGAGTVTRLDVTPAEYSFLRPGETADLTVRAVFADGTTADVAAFSEFRVKDDTVAAVSPFGQVQALRPGDTAVIATYRGTMQAVRVFVPVPAAEGAAYPPVPEASFIDREVFAKLRHLNIVPSDLSGDAEFLRRVTIDTIGSLPMPDEVRSFLADKSPDKRQRKIEELLAHPRHAALWATKFCDITGCNVDVMDSPPEVRATRARMWHDWFRRRVAADVPYDQIVKGVLLATSRDGADLKTWIGREVAWDQAAHAGSASTYAERDTLDLFWRRVEGQDFFPLEKMAEQTAAAFLGVRLECAQCHKHPFDRWTQLDYRSYANVFSRVRFESSPELTATTVDLLDARRKRPAPQAGPALPRLREVYIGDPRLRRMTHPDTGWTLKPKAPGGPELDDARDPRAALFEWLVRPDNPYFAPSFVNRVWAHYFGVGLVDPVDDFSQANPPTNARLLDALAQDFIAHGFDIRHLERTVLNSRTYQLTALPNATNRRDRTNYSHAYARPLMAEVVLDGLNDALGATEDFGADAPPGSRAIEVATNRVRSPHAARVFRVFGRPARSTACDCERPTEPALPQTLYLMSDPALLQKVTSGRLQALLAGGRPDAEVIDELFLATLSRFPDEREKQAALDRLRGAADRRTGYSDVVWALINTREFVLNH